MPSAIFLWTSEFLATKRH